MASPTLYLGIDPGISGGVAVIDGSISYTATKFTTQGDVHDWIKDTLLQSVTSHQYQLHDDFYEHGCFAMIEKVHSMPKQGVASTFKFGTNYGFWQGLLCAMRIPYEEVAPGTWQRSMGCLSGGNKNVTKTKAQALFPGIKITHAIADALLIAEYAKRIRSNGSAQSC